MDRERCEELCERAVRRDIHLFSRFLNLTEQREAEIAARKAGAQAVFYGGARDCERKMMGVGGSEAPETDSFPLACFLASPRSARFAGSITHRDVLGSLMSLGIDRELIGDLVVREEGAYVFCVENMVSYLMEQLEKIGGTDMRCALCEPPQGELRKMTVIQVQVSSPRLDSIVAHVFHLSRGDAQALFPRGRVMVDDALCERSDYAIKAGQVISVRGYGRARYEGEIGTTRKGKLNIRLSLYA